MATAAELYALQEIDIALDRDVARLAEIEDGLRESEELVQTRQLHEEKAQVVEELRTRQKELEWAVDEVRAHASQVEAKLYDGSVRNPKELSDLQADLLSLQGQTRKREDTLLGLLVELDDAESEMKQADTAYAETHARWQAAQEELRTEKNRIEPEIQQLQVRRSDRSGAIDGAALSLYKLLRERRAGQAVAKVERGMCQGCRITLPMSILQKARTALELVQCVSCERVLFVN